MKGKLMLLLACLFVGIGLVTTQTQKVTSIVISEEDEQPVIGASVLIKDTQIGTITSVDGDFTLLNVPSSTKTLRISFVGIQTQEIAVKPNVRVILKSDAEQLDEVVVTATGIERDRKALGYATQDLNSEQLDKAGTASLTSAIQGKLTDVDIRQSSDAPGASSQIIIRGAHSSDGNDQPLYVIDGMPIDTTADFGIGNSVTDADHAGCSIGISPEDIESVNMLKRQTASALYGVRTSNGVIVITAKCDSRNNINKPSVAVSTNLSAQRVSRKFKCQDIYSRGNSITAGYDPASSMTWGSEIGELTSGPGYGGNMNNQYTATDGTREGQYYSPKRTQAGLNGWTTPQIYDNVGNFLGTRFTGNTNINLSQSINGVNYSLGVNNSHQNGIIPSTGMDRWGTRGLVDWRINPQWDTGFSIDYSSTKITPTPDADDGIMNAVYSAPAEYGLKRVPNHEPGNPANQILFHSALFTNPYWWAEHNEYLQHTGRVLGNTYLEYQPNLGLGENPFLKVREQAGLNIWTSDYATMCEMGSTSSLKGGNIENYGSQHNIFNDLSTVNFDSKFGKSSEWRLNVVLDSEFNHESIRNWDYYGSNSNFPGFTNIGNATSLVSSEYRRQERTVGFFGSLSMSRRDQVYLTVTGRNDYVSIMPRGDRSFFYPSILLGWESAKLPFLQSNKILSYGKLRASFAQVDRAGNYYANYYYTPTYGGGMYSYYPVTYSLLSGVSTFIPYYRVYDEGLEPQNTTNYEIGADLHFFGSRLKVGYTYSLQNVGDQIFYVFVGGAIGCQKMLTNAGKVRTHAHELSINTAILQTKDFDLSLGINFTKVNNEIIELAPGVESIMLGEFIGPQVCAQTGCTYPNIYGLDFKRDEAGNLLLLNGLPQSSGSSQDLDSCSPDFTTGLTLGGRYKRLSLSTTWSWQQGGEMCHGANMTSSRFGITKKSLPYHEESMIAEGIDGVAGQSNTIEVNKAGYYQAYYNITESGIYDMSFIKSRDLALTYQLPKLGIFDISIYDFARNVFIWAGLPNFDPKSPQGNSDMSGCFERFSIPDASSFGGGLTINF